MNKKKRIEILDAAIKRINEYDKTPDPMEMTPCNMCSLLPSPDCNMCPFGTVIAKSFKNDSWEPACNHHKKNDGKGLSTRIFGTHRKEHQKVLINRTKKWCRRFLPEYTIEVIK